MKVLTEPAPYPRLRRVTDAYHFLVHDLTAVVDAEPRRMQMGTWYRRYHPLSNPSIFKKGAVPPCGTVGCLGGWTEVMIWDDGDTYGFMTAGNTLRLSDIQQEELFFDRELVNDWDQGSRVHADRVIAHVRAFAERYKDQLLNTILIPREMSTDWRLEA
jgi:hypothetical protein